MPPEPPLRSRPGTLSDETRLDHRICREDVTKALSVYPGPPTWRYLEYTRGYGPRPRDMLQRTGAPPLSCRLRSASALQGPSRLTRDRCVAVVPEIHTIAVAHCATEPRSLFPCRARENQGPTISAPFRLIRSREGVEVAPGVTRRRKEGGFAIFVPAVAGEGIESGQGILDV